MKIFLFMIFFFFFFPCETPPGTAVLLFCIPQSTSGPGSAMGLVDDTSWAGPAVTCIPVALHSQMGRDRPGHTSCLKCRSHWQSDSSNNNVVTVILSSGNHCHQVFRKPWEETLKTVFFITLSTYIIIGVRTKNKLILAFCHLITLL